MSLLFWDSFDHYDINTLLYKYTSRLKNGASSDWTVGAHGRNGTNALRLTNHPNASTYVRKAFGSTPDTVILGCAIRIVSLPDTSGEIFAFIDTVTIQILIRVVNNGMIQVYRGNLATWLGNSAPGVIMPNVYHYFEIKAVIANGVGGSVEIRVDGDVVVNLAGIDTQESGVAQVDQIQLGGDCETSVVWVHDYEDLYLCDDSGAYNNDFLGDTRVCALLPDADATHTDWAPSAGLDHYAMVDETPPDDDTTYNSSATATDRDSFDFEALPGTLAGTVRAVCAVICSRKDDAGARELDPSVRVGGTDYDGTTESIPSSYAFHNMYPWETNPDTAAPWLIAEVNALESGYELVA